MNNNKKGLIITTVIVVVLICINFFMGSISTLPGMSIDLSKDKVHSISKEAKTYLKNVKSEVNFVMFVNKQNTMKEIATFQSIVKGLADTNKNIKIKELDVADQSNQATMEAITKYSAKEPQLNFFSLVVENESDFFVASADIDQQKGTIGYENFESNVVNAVNKLVGENKDQTIEVPKKAVSAAPATPEEEQAPLEEKQQKTVIFMYVVLFPIIAFLVAIFFFMKKRKIQE